MKTQNEITRKDMSSVGPFTFFVNDGTKDITRDSGQKTYIEVDGNCVCKDHPTGFLTPDHGVLTLDACSALCIANTNCKAFLHSATQCLLYSKDCECKPLTRDGCTETQNMACCPGGSTCSKSST